MLHIIVYNQGFPRQQAHIIQKRCLPPPIPVSVPCSVFPVHCSLFIVHRSTDDVSLSRVSASPRLPTLFSLLLLNVPSSFVDMPLPRCSASPPPCLLLSHTCLQLRPNVSHYYSTVSELPSTVSPLSGSPSSTAAPLALPRCCHRCPAIATAAPLHRPAPPRRPLMRRWSGRTPAASLLLLLLLLPLRAGRCR